MPMHLPEAPPPAKPWDPPPGERARRDAIAAAGGEEATPEPRHCSSWHGGEESKCRNPHVPNLKQKRNVRLLSSMLGVEQPDVDAMSWQEAERFIGVHWKRFMERRDEL